MACREEVGGEHMGRGTCRKDIGARGRGVTENRIKAVYGQNLSLGVS